MVSQETIEALTPQVLARLPETARGIAKQLAIPTAPVSAVLLAERKKGLTELIGEHGKVWRLCEPPPQQLMLASTALPPVNKTPTPANPPVPQQSLMVTVAELLVRVKQLEKFVGIVS